MIKALKLIQNWEKHSSGITESLKNSWSWRWTSIFLMGLIGNTLINFAFDIKYHRPFLSFSISEYYNAVIASFFLLEGNRWLSKKMAQSNRSQSSLIRTIAHLVFSIIMLNVLVVGITYVFYQSFYAFADLLIINIGIVPLALIFSHLDNGKTIGEAGLSWKMFKWRWISVVLLGISCNTLVNIIFDYKYQRSLISFSIEEYFNAIVGAAILLGTTRWISKKLDKQFPWQRGVVRRLIIQLSLDLVLIIVILNILVIGITYVFYGGFYSFDELMVINISMVSLTFFFSSIDAGIYFFRNWKLASNNAKQSVGTPKKPIHVSLGKSQHLIDQDKIKCAVSKDGLVVIITEDDRRLPYPHSLEALTKELNPELFFRANRQLAVNRSVIKSLKSLDYGKLEISIKATNGQPERFTISRIRAADFRKWFKSQVS